MELEWIWTNYGVIEVEKGQTYGLKSESELERAVDRKFKP
jgi:hypothetical protein